MNNTLKRITDLITDYSSDQIYVRKILNKKFGIPYHINGYDWLNVKKSILDKYHENPFAKIFTTHGYGLEYKDSSVHIDFDFPVCDKVEFDLSTGKKYDDVIEFTSWNIHSYSGWKGIPVSHNLCNAFLEIVMAKSYVFMKDNLYGKFIISC